MELNIFSNTIYDNARLHIIYLVVLNKQCFLAYEFETCLSCMVLLSNTSLFYMKLSDSEYLINFLIFCSYKYNGF